MLKCSRSYSKYKNHEKNLKKTSLPALVHSSVSVREESFEKSLCFLALEPQQLNISELWE